jgi:spore coat polysaccharide biosynthesis predicted glycosyltransferase SpsG
MLALAQLLGDHGVKVIFATIGPSGASVSVDSVESFDRVALPETLAPGSRVDASMLVTEINRLRPDWVVLDGYAFDETYQRTIRATGVQLLSVDDLALGHFASDVILNQNFGAEHHEYSHEPYSRLKLGTGFVLLRREFRAAGTESRQEPPRRILITLGGGTVAASTALETIARGAALLDEAALAFRFIIGRLGSVPPTLLHMAKSAPERFQVLPHAFDMRAEMLESDLVVTSGGSTVWELMQSKRPFLAAALNEPQVEFLERLAAHGLCVSLGASSGLRAESVRDALREIIRDGARRRAMVSRGALTVNAQAASMAVLDIFGIRYSNSAT